MKAGGCPGQERTYRERERVLFGSKLFGRHVLLNMIEHFIYNFWL